MALPRNSTAKRVLVVEDELHIAEGLRLNLTLAGYEVQIAATGPQGLSAWKSWRPDLIVLDIMLPGIDGFSILKSIRLEDERLPILILSARGDVDDKIKGLNFGVDDYIPKPFNREEFLLRVKRLLERSSWASGPAPSDRHESEPKADTYTFGRNMVDFATMTAHCGGRMIRLSEQEIKLLRLFIKNKGRPMSRTEILEVGWGYTGGTATRTVDNFIVRFRKYFEDDPKHPAFFKSIRSVGYVFDD